MLKNQYNDLSDLEKNLTETIYYEQGTAEFEIANTNVSHNILITFSKPFSNIPTVQAAILNAYALESENPNGPVISEVSVKIVSVAYTGCVLSVSQIYTNSKVTGTLKWIAESTII